VIWCCADCRPRRPPAAEPSQRSAAPEPVGPAVGARSRMRRRCRPSARPARSRRGTLHDDVGGKATSVLTTGAASQVHRPDEPGPAPHPPAMATRSAPLALHGHPGPVAQDGWRGAAQAGDATARTLAAQAQGRSTRLHRRQPHRGRRTRRVEAHSEVVDYVLVMDGRH
jgi:hypothetical protein